MSATAVSQPLPLLECTSVNLCDILDRCQAKPDAIKATAFSTPRRIQVTVKEGNAAPRNVQFASLYTSAPLRPLSLTSTSTEPNFDAYDLYTKRIDALYFHTHSGRWRYYTLPEGKLWIDQYYTMDCKPSEFAQKGKKVSVVTNSGNYLPPAPPDSIASVFGTNPALQFSATAVSAAQNSTALRHCSTV